MSTPRTPPAPKSSVLAKRPRLLAREDLARAPVQRRSTRRRRDLVRAALKLFGERGYDAASIGDIARAAHVAVGGFYQYFRSKRQLLLVLMDELLAKLAEIDMRPQGGDPRAEVERVLRVGFAADVAYAGAFRAWREAILADAELARLHTRIRAWTTARVYEMCAALQRIAPARSRPLDLRTFAAILDEFFWQLLGRMQDSSAAAAGAVTIVHIIHHSLFTDGVD